MRDQLYIYYSNRHEARSISLPMCRQPLVSWMVHNAAERGR